MRDVDVRRLLPIGLAVTALLVLAGIASHGRPLSTGRGSGPTAGFFDYVATTILLLALALAVVVVVILLTGEKPEAGAPRRGRWNLISGLAMFFAACGIAYLLSSTRFQDRLRKLESQTHREQQPGGQLTAGKDTNGPGRNARVRWDEVAVVLVVVAGVAVWLYLRREKRKPLRPLALRRRAAVARALDDSLDDLRTDPDIRRAIIAAYARMEGALAAAGIGRRPAEAPYEYLARSLAELDAGAGAARRLTDLFERAKFSHHEPAERMRTDAIDALVAVRDDLRAATA
jgi:hypothetical protein